jgi:hypothetical protein
MNDENKVSPEQVQMSGAVRSWPEHDCYAWNVQVYCSRPEYLCSECGVCRSVTGFRWRKWWRRLFSVFSAEPHFKRSAGE